MIDLAPTLPYNVSVGPVEIGGMISKWCLQNPPPELLEAECEKNTAFALALLGTLPVVKVVSATSKPIGGGASKVKVIYRNEGFLATNGSNQAITTKAVRDKAIASVELSAGQAFVMGEKLMEMDHLAGRSGSYSPTSPVSAYGGGAANPHEGRLEFIVTGSGTVNVKVDWQRGGVTTATVEVNAAAATSSL